MLEISLCFPNSHRFWRLWAPWSRAATAPQSPPSSKPAAIFAPGSWMWRGSGWEDGFPLFQSDRDISSLSATELTSHQVSMGSCWVSRLGFAMNLEEVPRTMERGNGYAEPGDRSPDPSPPSLSPEPSQLGQQLPHVSCAAFKGDFPKRKSSHPTPNLPHVPKLKSFHGDSQIANPSKNELERGKKKPAHLQRTRPG